MKNFITTLVLSFIFGQLAANSPFLLRETLKWRESAVNTPLLEKRRPDVKTFEGAIFNDKTPGMPWLVRQFPLDGPGDLRVSLRSVSWENFAQDPNWPSNLGGDQIRFFTKVEKDRGRYFGKVYFMPLSWQGGRWQKAVEIDLQVDWTPRAEPELRSLTFAENSQLRDGQVFKIAVTQTGMHRLTYAFLKDQLKMDIDRIDPRNLKVFGHGGGMLPTDLKAPRTDDLVENHIQIVGEDDGRFDANDYLLLYAQGPDQWTYNGESRSFDFQKNIYDTRNYYYIKVASERGLRVTAQPSSAGGTYVSRSFDDFARFEEDKVNVMEAWDRTTGSGQSWYGDHFRNVREYSKPRLFTFPNLVTDSPAKVFIRMALRAENNSNFSAEVSGVGVNSPIVRGVDYLSGDGDNEIEYAYWADLQANVNLRQEAVDVNLRYPRPGGANDGSEAWLDFIQLQVRRQLIFTGEQMAFRDLNALQQPATTYEVGGFNPDIQVWDISNPLQPRLQEGNRNGASFSFGSNSRDLRTFMAFNSRANLFSPQAVGRVETQNLHALKDLDMLILYDAAGEFAEAANRLARHRQEFSGLRTRAIRVDQVYNEFSSGRQDATAIRDFARMLYQRNPKFRYLLLFGDGSFDARDIYKYGNNSIVTYQQESLNPLFAFPSDDYFGIMEESVFNDPLDGRLNVAVGRLTVNEKTDAESVVEKIINYDLTPATFTDWRNRLLYVGDDEDGNIHTGDVDVIAERMSQLFPQFNADKLYLDAFPQVATAGGAFYPSVNEGINNAIFKGVLAMTYLGHGGLNGWAQERVLTVRDIQSWNNFDRLPLIITATCSFTGYDDASVSTAGEEVLLNPRGGGVALYSTVRSVYASQNAELTRLVLEALFGEGPNNTLGDAMNEAKNQLSGGTLINARKFALIGDPAQRLAIPRYQAVTTRVNGKALSNIPDTLRALDKVSIEGQVVDARGNLLRNFNGVLYPSIFDKKFQARTLGQDPSSPRDFPFNVQKNVIFRGRATVRDGQFKFSFVVPKDINYAFDFGKISYYAADTSAMSDASGSFEQVVIGGLNSQGNFNDNKGPLVEVFMNSNDFVFGGITGPNPLLLVQLSDDNGINVVGNSIGHDLEAVLDDDTQNSFLLNDFFESAMDDFTKGTARYPLASLKEGLHKIRVKGWDVANNSAEGYTEFLVSSSQEIALQHVLNYPNPFTDRTCFQFDHNLANQTLDILVQVYTISGRLVKTIEATQMSDGSLRRGDCLEWDGRDDFGDRLARGVYIYKVKVRANLPGGTSLKGESGFEKLVLLK
jgi:hypothetical protein